MTSPWMDWWFGTKDVTLKKHEILEIIINEPGKYHIGADGVINRVE